VTALRWLFFIPLAFVASLLAGVFAYWFGTFMIVRYYDLYDIGEVIAWFGSGLGSGFAFIFVGMRIAPIKNNKVKWTLVAITMTLGIISAIGGFFGGGNHVVGLAGVAMVLIAYAAARSPVEQLILQKDRKAG